MKNTEWNNLRAKLHHDWMQKYLTFLMARIEYLDGVVETGSTAREDIAGQFVEFREKTGDFETLIDKAVEALSPAQLLDEYPLNRMPGEDREWLGMLVHALYCERTGIKERVKELREEFKSILDRHKSLTAMLKGENGWLPVKAGSRPFNEYDSRMKEFSRMISSLPHQVQVV